MLDGSDGGWKVKLYKQPGSSYILCHNEDEEEARKYSLSRYNTSGNIAYFDHLVFINKKGSSCVIFGYLPTLSIR